MVAGLVDVGQLRDERVVFPGHVGLGPPRGWLLSCLIICSRLLILLSIKSLLQLLLGCAIRTRNCLLSSSLRPFSVLLRRGKRCTQWADLIHITALAALLHSIPVYTGHVRTAQSEMQVPNDSMQVHSPFQMAACQLQYT